MIKKLPILVVVEGGVVQDVFGLPKGMTWELLDHDNCESGDCGHEGNCTIETDKVLSKYKD